MNWLRRMLYGRYGMDQLTLALWVAALLCTFGFSFSPLRLVGTLLGYAFLLVAFIRVFSRKPDKRRKENEKFLRLWNPIVGWFRLQKRKLSEHQTFRYFHCPKCRQRLRAPRGRGKIRVTCQKCHNEFVKKV